MAVMLPIDDSAAREVLELALAADVVLVERVAIVADPAGRLSLVKQSAFCGRSTVPAGWRCAVSPGARDA